MKPAGRKPIAGADEEGETRNLIHPRTDISTARRIEMIARVMAKPDAAIRRIARSIARLPLSAMQARLDYFTPTGLWMHGEQEYADARAHERCAIRVFYRALEAG